MSAQSDVLKYYLANSNDTINQDRLGSTHRVITCMKGVRTKTTPSPAFCGSPEVAMSAHADTHKRLTMPSHMHVYMSQGHMTHAAI